MFQYVRNLFHDIGVALNKSNIKGYFQETMVSGFWVDKTDYRSLEAFDSLVEDGFLEVVDETATQILYKQIL